MKLTLSKQRSWFAAAAGLVATAAIPAAAHPPEAAAVEVNLAAEGQAPTDPDDTIVSEIRAKFGADSQLKRTRISVGSENGVVTLAGSAPNSISRDRAVQFARETPGVFRVDNFIRLDVSSPEAPVPP
jgi:hyperosmotically inducible periplasmic protein